MGRRQPVLHHGSCRNKHRHQRTIKCRRHNINRIPADQLQRYRVTLCRTGTTSSSSLEYIGHTQNSKAGEYTVNIITAGLNVSGTINGEAATGSGQILTGNTDNANTEGLSVKYTGMDTGDIGTIKFTTGVAELFDRTLFSITDPYEGYVSFKESSLQNSIDDSQTRIDQMEAQLLLKKQTMINSFVMMETALNNIQTQSSWLTSQISAAEGGWKAL